MAKATSLVARSRSTRGSGNARRLRRKGEIPAVIYGHKEATLSLSFNTDEVAKAVRQGVHVVDIQLDGKTEKALIRELQWDHLGKELLHIDLARVGADERIVVTVPVEIRGTAPGIAAGGVLDQPLHSIAVECPVIHVPESVRVNVSALLVGQVIHVRDLVLPDDVKVMADEDAVVVQVIAKQVEAEPTAVPAPDQSEPEVIGRKAAENEEAEEKPSGKK